jgi:hypothetical protein
MFVRMMEGQAASSATPKMIIIDGTDLKAHRTASSLRIKKGTSAAHRSHQGRHEYEAPRRHGRERSPAELLHDRWLGQRLLQHGRAARRSAQGAVDACRPRLRRRLVQGRSSGKEHHALHSGTKIPNVPINYDKRRYRSRSRIEIMFGRLKGWRRAAARYDRCPTVLFSAIALAATVIFWL